MILQYAWHLQKEGYRESTILSRVKMLRGLARKANLVDSDAVKGVIAGLRVCEGRKENLVGVYSGFCRLHRLEFKPPRYRRVERLPFVPLESEVDQLIAGVGVKMAAYLQLLKETGARAGEACSLQRNQ